MPSTFVTGYRYALLGYTTVVEAAAPPLAARHVLAELRDTPMIDAAFLLLMGNNLALFDLIRRDPARVRDAIAWWLEATGGYGVKLVNPGGVERWKPATATSPRSTTRSAGVTPRAGDRDDRRRGARARAAAPRPRPLQQPRRRRQLRARRSTRCARWTGRRAHLAHLQFHAYGGKPGGRPRSRAPELAEYIGAHPEISADVGQVMFGDATTMTADAPVSEPCCATMTGGKWVNADTEVETGCGIVPFTYREKNYVHALQWGIGLELFLLSRDPWRIVLSTDHPERRLVPQLPEADPAAHGPRRSATSSCAGRTSRRSSAPCCSTTSTASTRSRRSRSSPAPGRRACSACATRAISAPAPTPT